MIWEVSDRADPTAAVLADRHYSRRKIGSPQFVPPGRCLVLKAETANGNAYWVTSWPFAEYVKHAWAGAWVCSAFRNEGAGLSSDLIKQAVAATRARYGEPPEQGMITFVDKGKVRGKRDFGYCFIKAGFKPCGETKGGLAALQLLAADMPKAQPPRCGGLLALMEAAE
jgi:hypothetical protein